MLRRTTWRLPLRSVCVTPGRSSVAGQVLIYPCTDGPLGVLPVGEQFGNATWVWDEYGGGRDLAGDPYAIPMHATSLKGLPPASWCSPAVTCSGTRVAPTPPGSREDGVDVDEVCYPGQPHGFINHGFPAAAPAWDQIGGWLRCSPQRGAA